MKHFSKRLQGFTYWRPKGDLLKRLTEDPDSIRLVAFDTEDEVIGKRHS